MSGIVGTNVGTSTYVVASGFSCITSGPAELYGVLLKATATGTFQIFSSNTATASTAICGVIGYTTQAGTTANMALYFPFPRDFPAGFCVSVIGSDPSTTLFWNPKPGQ